VLRLGLAARVRKGTKLMGGASGSERGGAKDGRLNPKRKTYFGENANGTRARWAGRAERWPAGKARPSWTDLGRTLGRL
jgi:hypothetical protein